MSKYLVRRLLLALVTVWGVTLFLFLLVRFIPGDAAMMQLGETYSGEEGLRKLRSALGLDRPLYLQYLTWMGGVLRGDLGLSMHTGEPVLKELARRLPVTVELGVLSLGLSILIGIPIGIISAMRQDTPLDHGVRILSIGFISVPSFWMATMVIVMGAIWLHWLPPIRYAPLLKDPSTNMVQFFLPALLLALASAGSKMRFVRASLLEVFRQDYIRTARAKGLMDRVVIYRHALKNAFIPVMTLIGIQFAYILGGTVIIESIFALPGMGTMLLTAVARRDYTQLQAIVLVISLWVVLINLAVDIMYSWLDPRIRYR